MNTTATYPASDHSSRRASTETVFSLQGKETDFARDTSDTETVLSDTDRDLEYEPVTEPEDEGGPVNENTSAESDNEIISTKVIEVSVGDDGDLEFADSEQTDSYESDSEMDLYDYWHCAQCRAENNNSLYRYCQKCFKVRKNFFPPRPKRKHKRDTSIQPQVVPRTLSQDSGVESPNSQEIVTQESKDHGEGTSRNNKENVNEGSLKNVLIGSYMKRRAESADRTTKRMRLGRSDSESDLDSDKDVKSQNILPLVKTTSDPSITIEDSVKMTKKAIVNTLKEKLDTKDLCVVCISEPKSGVFVHGRIAHICCCYKCAVKVWAKAKRCPVCNCKVSNVLRAVVM